MERRISRLRRRAGIAVTGLSLAAMAAVVLAAWLLSESLSASRMERRIEIEAAADHQLVQAANALLQAVTDAETGQRGYLLTERREFLQPYATASRRARDALTQLARSAPDDPAIRRLGALAQDRLRTIDVTLALARAGRRNEAIAAMDGGRSLMDGLRAEVQALLARAEANGTALAAERSRSLHRMQMLQAGQAVATLVALAIAIVTLLVERLTARLAGELQAQLTAETDAAKRAAEEADRAKSRFLAAASHDMRQPLHALALYISALELRVDSPEAREILGNMDSAVRAMSRLFTALLDLARLEAGVLKPEPVDFAVSEILHEVAEHSLDLRGRREVKVTVAPTRLQVRTDPDLLEIALRNLATNAVKHSRGGRVLLGCRRVDGEVRIEVHDDGEGIPESDLRRIFSEFVRGERAGGTEGVGLGLAIVDRLAKLLGHPLSVRSRVGRGSVFAITVPRSGGELRPVAPAQPQRAPQLQGARILLADDEPLALDAMRGALRDAGVEVDTATSAAGVEADAAEGYDAYVFDLNLAGDDGLELLADVERRLGAPVRGLIVTGTTTTQGLDRLRRSGRPWLTKPLSADELLEAVSRLMTAS